MAGQSPSLSHLNGDFSYGYVSIQRSVNCLNKRLIGLCPSNVLHFPSGHNYHYCMLFQTNNTSLQGVFSYPTALINSTLQVFERIIQHHQYLNVLSWFITLGVNYPSCPIIRNYIIIVIYNLSLLYIVLVAYTLQLL